MSGSRDFWSLATSRLFLTVAVGALVAVSAGIVNVALRRSEVEREVEALKAELRQSEGSNDELRRLIEYFSTPEYREREARLRLGLQKPGENVVVVPGVGEAAGVLPPTSPALPNWRLWYNYFFVD